MGESIPPEVVEQLRRFNEALTLLEDTYQKHFSDSLEENAQNRTKEYMGRLKQLEERKAAPYLNQRAARSFVRNALWEPKKQQMSGISDEGDANKKDERFAMESSGDALKGAEMDEEQMEEEDEALVNSRTAKSAPKRLPREANIVMAGGTLPKKKRL